MNFGDDHIGRLMVTLLILVAWFTVLIMRPDEADKAGTVAALVVGHYFGREAKNSVT